jgi:hypothetical protein
MSVRSMIARSPVGQLLVLAALVAWAGPVAAQVTNLRPITAPIEAVPMIDYKAEYEKFKARNQELRSENAALKARLDEWTRKGGSLVHAYCESSTVSRSSAGARNDCAVNGFNCEPVSGLCRTVANSSSDCAGTYLYCPTTRQCVPPDPRACP